MAQLLKIMKLLNNPKVWDFAFALLLAVVISYISQNDISLFQEYILP